MTKKFVRVYRVCNIMVHEHYEAATSLEKTVYCVFTNAVKEKTKRCDRGEVNIGHKYASTDMYVLIDVNYVQQSLLKQLPYKNQ